MPLRNPSGVQPTLIVPQPVGSFAAGVLAANRAHFSRFQLATPGTFRYINWTCAVQSGNIQAGVVALSGTGRTTYSVPIVSTGIIACPAAGDIRSDLDAFALPAGDYALFLWVSDGTVSVSRSTASPASMRVSAIKTLTASGVIASDVFTFSATAVALSLEADV